MDLRKNFTIPLLEWFDIYGRIYLPWKKNTNPYHIWISEIMLQRTRVSTVIPYFKRFIIRFPNIWAIFYAHSSEIYKYWYGLGYYNRVSNIIRSSKIICNKYNGNFPTTLNDISSLPGIGETTASAIASQAFNLPTAIFDCNVQRILNRYFIRKNTINSNIINKKKLKKLANLCMSMTRRYSDYTQAIMDLGSICCKPRFPHCVFCPLKNYCLTNKKL